MGILRNESSWVGTRIEGLGNCPQTHEPHQCTLASTGECVRLPIFSAGKGEGQQQQWILGVLSKEHLSTSPTTQAARGTDSSLDVGRASSL